MTHLIPLNNPKNPHSAEIEIGISIGLQSLICSIYCVNTD
nr:MAG TPA: hypothetical protein [Caudoviricetes sp.]